MTWPSCVRALSPPGRDRRLSGDAGASMVEFALVIGLLLFLILGAVSLGLLLSQRDALDQAAGEAARAAAITAPNPDAQPGDPDPRVVAAQASLSAASQIGHCDQGGLTCSVSIDPCPNAPADSCVTVVLVDQLDSSSPVEDIPLLGDAVPRSISSRASAVVSGNG